MRVDRPIEHQPVGAMQGVNQLVACQDAPTSRQESGEKAKLGGRQADHAALQDYLMAFWVERQIGKPHWFCRMRGLRLTDSASADRSRSRRTRTTSSAGENGLAR